MTLTELASMNPDNGYATVQFLSDDPQRDVSTFLSVVHSLRSC